MVKHQRHRVVVYLPHSFDWCLERLNIKVGGQCSEVITQIARVVCRQWNVWPEQLLGYQTAYPAVTRPDNPPSTGTSTSAGWAPRARQYAWWLARVLTLYTAREVAEAFGNYSPQYVSSIWRQDGPIGYTKAVDAAIKAELIAECLASLLDNHTWAEFQTVERASLEPDPQKIDCSHLAEPGLYVGRSIVVVCACGEAFLADNFLQARLEQIRHATAMYDLLLLKRVRQGAEQTIELLEEMATRLESLGMLDLAQQYRDEKKQLEQG